MHRITNPPATPPEPRFRLTPEGLGWFGVLVLLAIVGWYKGLTLVLLLAYLMAALLVLNGVLARIHVARVTASRDPAPPVFVGEETRIVVRVKNTAARGAVVGVVDIAGRPGGWFLTPAPPRHEVELVDRQTFSRRGRFPATHLVAWSGFPFGFLRYELPTNAGTELVVLPAVGTADADGLRRWVLGQLLIEGRARRVLRRVTSDQADVRGVRPYRVGDSLRSIHWRSSARRRELVVREYDAAPSPDLVLVVEPWLPPNPTDADRANLEAALSLAATAVRTWCQHLDTRVTVVVPGAETGTEIVRTGPPTEAFARESLIPLADVTGQAAFALPAMAAFGRSLASAARVVVSSRRASPLAATLTDTTGRPFVALDPSQWLGWYQAPRATTG